MWHAHRRLNKLGTFNLSQLGQSKSPFAEFMRAQRKSNENFEESLLKLVRTLPAVLKYLPSEKAQVHTCGCCPVKAWMVGRRSWPDP